MSSPAHARSLRDDRRPESLGVNVEELYEGLEAYLQELSERRKAGAGWFDRWLAPRVRFVGKLEEGSQAS